MTQSALLVSLAALFNWLPTLLFSLFAGALSDRVNRRRIVVAVDLTRCAILVLLIAVIVTGAASIPIVLAALFALAAVEVFGDNAALTLLPTLIPRDELTVGNARIQTGFITLNHLAGPPVGAALFAVGQAWPFAAEAVIVLAGAALVTRVMLGPNACHGSRDARIRTDIADGFRWVRRHAAVRTLVVTIFTFNITFGAAFSVLVLYATRRLGLPTVGFGLITTTIAVGGLIGTLSYGWITRRVSLGNVMRIGLIVETLTHLGLALTTVAWVALLIFLVFGAHAFIWGTTSVTVRQRATPPELQGRVGSANDVGTFGGLVLGSGIGGVLAQHFGVTAPFWFAFVGSAIFLVLIWRQLSHIAHDEPMRTTWNRQ